MYILLDLLRMQIAKQTISKHDLLVVLLPLQSISFKKEVIVPEIRPREGSLVALIPLDKSAVKEIDVLQEVVVHVLSQ